MGTREGGNGTEARPKKSRLGRQGVEAPWKPGPTPQPQNREVSPKQVSES